MLLAWHSGAWSSPVLCSLAVPAAQEMHMGPRGQEPLPGLTSAHGYPQDVPVLQHPHMASLVPCVL